VGYERSDVTGSLDMSQDTGRSREAGEQGEFKMGEGGGEGEEGYDRVSSPELGDWGWDEGVETLAEEQGNGDGYGGLWWGGESVRLRLV
jgi:hypothetical protein